MGFLPALITALLAAAAVVLLTIRAVRPSNAHLARRINSLASASGLAVTDAVAEAVTRRVRRDITGSEIGFLVGIVVGGALLLGSGPSVNDLALDEVPLALVGGAVGSAVVTLISRGVALSGARIARSRAVELADYLAPVERWSARALPLLSVCSVALVAAWSPEPTPSDLLGQSAVATLAVLGWVAFELAGRGIVRRPQSASTTTELAWDDALRAASVRSLADAAIAAGFFALYLLVLPALVRVPAGVGGVFALCLVVFTVFMLLGQRWPRRFTLRPQRYFLTRLWPTTAAAATSNEAIASSAPR